MNPVIRLPEPLFKRLQHLAEPLVDTPATVIERAVTCYETTRGGKNRTAPGAADHPPTGVSRWAIPSADEDDDPENPPDLAHTRILAATFGHNQARNWNDLLKLAHREAMEKLGSFDSLKRATLSNVVKGRRTERGFHYLEEIDLSIQNVEANLAWRHTLHLAKKVGLPVRVEYEWRNNTKAAHPSKRRTLLWSGSGSPN